MAEGHGVNFALEQDPTGAQGTFTRVHQLSGTDVPLFDISRAVTDVTAQEHRAAVKSLSRVMDIGDLVFSSNYSTTEASLDDATGVIFAILNEETRGVRIWGPGGSAGSDEFIASGAFSNVKQTNPHRSGQRKLECTFTISGPFILDGTTYGADV